MDRIRPLVKSIEGSRVQYFPESDEASVKEGKLPKSLPSIWHVVYSIDDQGILTLDKNYLKSIAYSVSDIVGWMETIGLKPVLQENGKIAVGVPVNEINSIVSSASKSKLRTLTQKEIDDIINSFPIFPAATEAAVEVIERNIKNFYRDRLRKYQVDPNSIGILKNTIIDKLERSIMPAGSSVGIMMADALAAQLMQGTLDAKRFGGASANINQSIAALSEILRAQKPKFPSMTLFFKDRNYTPDDCNRFIDTYEYVQLSDIIKNMEADIRIEPNNLSELWWVQIYVTLTGIDIPETPDMMVIQLDQSAMYYDAVTMKHVTEALSNLAALIVIPSPIQIGQILLIPDPDQVEDILRKEKIKFDLEYAGHVYLSAIIKPKLAELPIKGTKGCTYMYIKYKNINPLIIDEYHIEGQTWELEFNQSQMTRDCLKIADIYKLLKALGFEIKSKIKKIVGNKILVNFSGKPIKQLPGMESEYAAPMKYIIDIINADKKQHEKIESERQKESPIYLKPDTELMKANRVYYIETDGSNLKEILFAPELNYKYCYTNVFDEMLYLFGIGVTRMTLMMRLSNTIGDGDKYIDPAWILQCTDNMTNRGKISGINFTGLQETQSDIFGLISSERPAELTLKWAAVGKSQKTGGVSGKISIGRPPLIGSEIVKVVEDRELVRKLTESGMKVDPDIIQAKLRQLDSKPEATKTPKFKTPKTPEPQAVKFNTNEETSDIIDVQPTIMSRPNLILESVEGFLSVPALDDIVVKPRNLPSIAPKNKNPTVALNSVMPVFDMPDIAKFTEIPGLPKFVIDLIEKYK